MNQEIQLETSIDVLEETPSYILKEVLEEIPDITFLDINFLETGLSIRGLKQQNQIMILYTKDTKDNYKHNNGWQKSTIHIALDINKLGDLNNKNE